MVPIDDEKVVVLLSTIEPLSVSVWLAEVAMSAMVAAPLLPSFTVMLFAKVTAPLARLLRKSEASVAVPEVAPNVIAPVPAVKMVAPLMLGPVPVNEPPLILAPPVKVLVPAERTTPPDMIFRIPPAADSPMAPEIVSL